MELLDVYTAMQRGDINHEGAAAAMGISTRRLKFSLTRYNHRFPLLLSVLDKMRRNEIERTEAAKALQVSPREINHLQKSWNVVKAIPKYLVMKATAGVKWELRKKFAIDFIAGSCTIEEAAEGARVTTRQMYRWVEILMKKHFGAATPDLRKLSHHKRNRMALEIEEAERLELPTQNVLNEIAAGYRTLQQVALERVMDKRKRRGR